MKIKRIVEKVRQWLILKLGWYVIPTERSYVYKSTIEPVIVCGYYEADYEWLRAYAADNGEEELKKRIEDYLVDIMADKIRAKGLYTVDCGDDYKRNCRVYRIRCLVCPPIIRGDG